MGDTFDSQLIRDKHINTGKLTFLRNLHFAIHSLTLKKIVLLCVGTHMKILEKKKPTRMSRK